MSNSTAAIVSLADAEATEQLGARLGRLLVDAKWDDALILLDGELGAGKTTMARGFLRGLGYQGRVPSPTYTLLEPYEIGRLNVSHLDLYRLADASELEHIGWRDIANTVRLVEWSSRAPALRDSADWEVSLTLEGAARRARICALSERALRLMRRLSPISP